MSTGVAMHANKILEYGSGFLFPVAVAFTLMLLWLVIVRGGRIESDRFAAVFWITGIIALFAGFLFLNAAGADILYVAQSNRAWGAYIGALFALCSAAVLVGLYRYRQHRSQDFSYALPELDSVTLKQRRIIPTLLLVVPLIGVIVGVVWLWEIAH